MSTVTHVQRSGSGANLVRWICTKNPFYAISAALVLAGLWVSFGKQTEAEESLFLMGGLGAYTMLLAGTAMLLVRYLKVWDDARTVLLLVVLMFLATSVTFDHVLMIDPPRGVTCCLLGLALSIIVSEWLLRTIQLRLPAWYRGPYYVILALFFLYPIFVRSLMDPFNPMQEPAMWGLFGFATAAGLAYLTLLPAVRRGAVYMHDSSPWPWPLYPWSLFVMLAIAVPGRAVFICWSLHNLDAHNFDRLVFGPYFLVPFGFALTVLLLEMGIVSGNRRVLRAALALPLLLIVLALVGHGPGDPLYRMLRVLTVPIGRFGAFGAVRLEPDPVYAEFLRIFSYRLGADPLFMTLALTAVFYAYASVRRVPMAVDGLSAAVAAMSVVATNSLKEGLLAPPAPWPLLLAGMVQVILAVRRTSPWNYLLGTACLAATVAILSPVPDAEVLRIGLFVHLVMLAMLVLGVTFPTSEGRSIRRLGAGAMLLLAFAVMHEGVRLPEDYRPAAAIVYPVAAGLLLALYGQLLRDSFVLVLATVILGYWVFKFGWTAYRAIRTLFRGLDYIVWGAAFFVLAVLVSLGKSGMLLRWIEARWGEQRWLRGEERG